jgi:hypothetical protein
MAEITHLPTSSLTAKALLQLLANTHGIDGVAVVIKWGDGSMSTRWSNMTVAELCMAAKVLDRDVTGEVEG